MAASATLVIGSAGSTCAMGAVISSWWRTGATGTRAPASRYRYPGDQLVFGYHGPVQPTGRQTGLDEADRLVDIDVLRAPQGEVVAGRLVIAEPAGELRPGYLADVGTPAS